LSREAEAQGQIEVPGRWRARRVPVVTEPDADEQVGTELSATAEVATPLPSGRRLKTSKQTGKAQSDCN